jgi:hypothetical protein
MTDDEMRALVKRRLSNTEIAQELSISDTTVKTHVTHILQKLKGFGAYRLPVSLSSLVAAQAWRHLQGSRARAITRSCRLSQLVGRRPKSDAASSPKTSRYSSCDISWSCLTAAHIVPAPDVWFRVPV